MHHTHAHIHPRTCEKSWIFSIYLIHLVSLFLASFAGQQFMKGSVRYIITRKKFDTFSEYFSFSLVLFNYLLFTANESLDALIKLHAGMHAKLRLTQKWGINSSCNNVFLANWLQIFFNAELIELAIMTIIGLVETYRKNYLLFSVHFSQFFWMRFLNLFSFFNTRSEVLFCIEHLILDKAALFNWHNFYAFFSLWFFNTFAISHELEQFQAFYKIAFLW